MAPSEIPPRQLRLRVLLLALAATLPALGLVGSVRKPARGPAGKPPPASVRQRWGEVYRRQGDTFMSLFYRAHAASGETALATQFLQQAMYYYKLGVWCDPNDQQSVASLALVETRLGPSPPARPLLFRPLTLPESKTKEQIRSVVRILVGTRPDPTWLREVTPLLHTFAPGYMALADAYRRIGEADLADREWGAGEQRAARRLPALLGMIAFCGLLMLAGVTGLAIWMLRQVRWLLGRRPAPATLAPAPPWTAAQGLQAVLLWAALGFGWASAARWLLPAAGWVEATSLVVGALLAGAGAMLWVGQGRARATAFGWQVDLPVRRLAVGIAAGGLLAFPLAWLRQWIQSMVPQGAVGHPAVVVLATAGPAGRVGIVAFACLLVPIIEETVFRGILYRSLRRTWSAAPAAAASGLLFAVAHGDLAGLVSYLMLGVVCAYLYERAGSLLAPAAGHAAFNAFQMAVLIVFTGQ